MLEVIVDGKVAGYVKNDLLGRKAVERFVSVTDFTESVVVRIADRIPQGARRLDR